jgi:hypothetical protein
MTFWEIYTHTDIATGNTTPGIFVAGGSLFLIGRFAFDCGEREILQIAN